MPTKAERILFMREAAKLNRLHTVPTVKEYTIGIHSHGMLDLLFVMFPEDCSYELIFACHMHDKAERIVGDVPWPAKYPLTGGVIAEELEKLEHRVEKHLGMLWEQQLNMREQQILKFLDMFEFCLWCQDEVAMGNKNVKAGWFQAVSVIQNHPLLEEPAIYKTVKDLIKEDGHDITETTDWYREFVDVS